MRVRRWHCAAAAAVLVCSTAIAQIQAPGALSTSPLPAPVPALTPAQQAAVLLGRWETCIDLAAQFLAYSTLSSKRSVVNVERRCVHYQTQLRPVLARSLTDMMYGSSEEQVAAQTDVAVESLRRHIHARATAAVKRVRAK